MGGAVAADAPPAIAKDIPAIPTAGTAFLRRLRFEARFAFDIASPPNLSNVPPPPDRLSIAMAPCKLCIGPSKALYGAAMSTVGKRLGFAMQKLVSKH